MTFTIKSSAFSEGSSIPSIYTCDGDDISPPLSWHDEPANTKSFVLIVDDPDAPIGNWDHWLLYNIPATTHTLNENLTSTPSGANGGKNSWGNTNYGGPCPPDREHRYFFKLYALDCHLDLTSNATKSKIESAMDGHILGTATLMGKYNRS
ncbi:MAG: YbhB/YbcL family Raf kinase inhibitor-like protein [Gammaproteobacteria bacterium]|nr:YbhB/YbcL family Raf kinase inhibitor-like protein [Gammaproteobacteria bacterium]